MEVDLNTLGLYQEEPRSCWQRWRRGVGAIAGLTLSVGGRVVAGAQGALPTITDIGIGVFTQSAIQSTIYALSETSNWSEKLVTWWRWRQWGGVQELSVIAYGASSQAYVNLDPESPAGQTALAVLLIWGGANFSALIAAARDRNAKERVVQQQRDYVLQQGHEDPLLGARGRMKLKLPCQNGLGNVVIQLGKLAPAAACLTASYWSSLTPEDKRLLEFWGAYLIAEPAGEMLGKLYSKWVSRLELEQEEANERIGTNQMGSVNRGGNRLDTLRFIRDNFGIFSYTLAGILLNYSHPATGAVIGLPHGFYEACQQHHFTKTPLVKLVDVQKVHYQGRRHKICELAWKITRFTAEAFVIGWFSERIFTDPENTQVDHFAWGTFLGTFVAVLAGTTLIDRTFVPGKSGSVHTALFYRTVVNPSVFGVDPSTFFLKLLLSGVPLSDGALKDVSLKDIAIPLAGQASWATALASSRAQVDSSFMGSQPLRSLFPIQVLNIQIAWWALRQ